MSIRVSVEGERGCGRRKPGGLYLVSGQLSEPCPLLPIPLDRCPHCGQGIGPARGWTWITPGVLVPAQKHGSSDHNDACPFGTESPFAQYGGDGHVNFANTGHRMGDRAGLIWIGEKFYPTPEAFMAEAAAMGVSRRVKAVPRGFEVGRDWVILAHRKAVPVRVIDKATAISMSPIPGGVGLNASIDEEHPEFTPGIITAFKPTAIEYVVKGNETEEEIAALEERGIQPVEVVTPGEDELRRRDDRIDAGLSTGYIGELS
jgi:hypothetical protein